MANISNRIQVCCGSNSNECSGIAIDAVRIASGCGRKTGVGNVACLSAMQHDKSLSPADAAGFSQNRTKAPLVRGWSSALCRNIEDAKLNEQECHKEK